MDETTTNNLNEFLGFNTSDLKREKGDFQFTDVSKEIDGLFSFGKDLQENPNFYNYLPELDQENVRNLITRINDIFKRIVSFKPSETPNPQDTRNNWANEVKQAYKDSFNYIIFLDVFRSQAKGAQAKFSSLNTEAKRALQDIEKARGEALELVETLRKTTSKAPLYKYLGIYEKQYEHYRNLAYGSLAVSVVLIVILVIGYFTVGNSFAESIVKVTTNQQIIALVFTKLFFFFVIFFILQQAIRNYMANMHQAVLNKHRENSLKVFDAMVKGATGDDTSDEVLSYLSKSIFDSGDTGFFPGKDSSRDGTDLIQIFKDFTKK